jgi:hypothetical protein
MSKFGLEHPYLCALKNNIDWPLIHVFGWVFAVMFLDGASWNARPDATSGLGRGGGGPIYPDMHGLVPVRMLHRVGH